MNAVRHQVSSIAASLVSRRIITPVEPDDPPKGFKEGKFIIFVGGGKASGKSTYLEYLFDALEQEGYQKDYIGKMGTFVFEDVLNHPLVRPLRVAFNKHTKQKLAAIETGSDNVVTRLIDYSLHTCFSQKSPIFIDNHMDNPMFVDHVLKQAQEHGYETILISPHIEAETYFERVEKRKTETGRPYSLSRGLSTHRDFAQNIDHYIKNFDLTIIVDNNRHVKGPSGREPIAIATPKRCHVLDERGYANVRRKARLNPQATKPEELYTERSYPEPTGDPRRGAVALSHGEGSRTGEKPEIMVEGKFVRKIRGMFERQAGTVQR